MPEKVRVGIIGAGKIAQARHIPLMQSVGDVYITHAWSRTPETAQKAAREFGNTERGGPLGGDSRFTADRRSRHRHAAEPSSSRDSCCARRREARPEPGAHGP